MRTIISAILFTLVLGYVVQPLSAADNPPPQPPRELVGSKPLPEEIEEARRLAALA